MKRRNGFVSNSSSSSFIVIGDANLYIPELTVETLRIPGTFGGEEAFGWQVATYDDLGSRLNFCVLQSEDNKEYREMLETVLKEVFTIDSIHYNVDGYIDHASSAREQENTEMFDSEENLKRFLFSHDSLIENDNDNY